jgi:hypothetical protein
MSFQLINTDQVNALSKEVWGAGSQASPWTPDLQTPVKKHRLHKRPGTRSVRQSSPLRTVSQFRSLVFWVLMTPT